MSVDTPGIYRIVVRGRVQGVGFRYYTQDLARALGIAGWVRNLPNGDVESMARLDGTMGGRFMAGLRRGPPASRVEDVQATLQPPETECPQSGFNILRY